MYTGVLMYMCVHVYIHAHNPSRRFDNSPRLDFYHFPKEFFLERKIQDNLRKYSMGSINFFFFFFTQSLIYVIRRLM